MSGAISVIYACSTSLIYIVTIVLFTIYECTNESPFGPPLNYQSSAVRINACKDSGVVPFSHFFIRSPCREIRKNVPRFFNHESNTLAYFSQKAYVFDKATSCAGCDPVKDKFVTINIPLLVSWKFIINKIDRP